MTDELVRSKLEQFELKTCQTEGARSTSRRPRFELVPFGKIAPSPRARYAIKGLIPRHGLVVVWGPPKCGKSFVVFDLAMHVALGWPYRGRRVTAGSVVYCALEGQTGFQTRAEAFRKHYVEEVPSDAPLYLMSSPMSLVRDHRELVASIRQQLPSDALPAVVVIDTLNRSFSGSESDDEAMTAFVRAADAIRDAFDCAVIVVHHCGLEGTRPRGHSSLAGAVDAQLAVRKGADGVITVTTELVKDGLDGETFTSRLESIEVGTDDDGDPITSCVVIEAGEPAPRTPRKRPLSDRERLALDALIETLIHLGAKPPATMLLPSDVRCVEVKAWREELFQRGLLDRDASGHREQFRRIREKLIAGGHVAVRDELVWRQ